MTAKKNRAGEKFPGSVVFSPRLEVQLETELDESWKVDLVRDHAKIGAAESPVGRPKLRVIEEVKELRPKLEVDVLGDRRSLEHGEVKVHNTLLSQRGINAWLVAEVVRSRSSEAAGVEPSIDP